MQHLLSVHSLLRWGVLLFGCWAVLAALSGVMSKRNFTANDNRAGLFFMIFCDLQLLAGLILYFNNSWFSQLTSNAKEVMHTGSLRFYAVEHALMMIIAWLLVHIGRSMSKRAGTDAQKHKKALVWFGIALLIILLMIPWPFREGIGRQLFPQF